MNKKQLIFLINFSLHESKNFEDRFYRKEIQSYLTQLNKRKLKTITSEFII